MPPRALRLAVLPALAVVALAGCSAGPPPAHGLAVLASFYPLQFVAQEVEGDRVTVQNLTKPGTEPHDLELAPQDVAAVDDADLVVYLAGFQPALDAALEQAPPAHQLDVTGAARLDLTGSEGTDPHFWLDPTRLADVADATAAALAQADPAGAAAYRSNAAALRVRLEALDRRFREGLATCSSRYLVTSHAAFGYLADRYGLDQVPITGLVPEAEPTSSDLATVATFVTEHDVSTIFYETLVSPAVAEALAKETGATTAVLDPLEGMPPGADGDYFSVMRANLAALQKGLGCT